MNITVVGGGNIGTQFAAHCCAHGHRVSVYTSQFDTFPSSVKVIDANGDCILSGAVECATYDPRKAVKDCDVIIITTPAFLANEIAEKLTPYIEKNTKVIFVPGSGGMEWAFKSLLDKECSLYGLQRVPSVARLKEKGAVYCEGYRGELHIAALPKSDIEFGRRLIENLFDTPCTALDNYLNVTMVPSNPILHTCRLYSLFNDYSPGKVYESIPLFYQDWTDEASALLFECDDEVQHICGKINSLSGFDMSCVKSLKAHYESYTVHDMTEKIKSIKGFQGLTTPSKMVDSGYVPDFDSRYFTADFPYGLQLLCEIAQLCQVETPYMHRILSWYNKIVSFHSSFHFSDYGVHVYDELNDFYAM